MSTTEPKRPKKNEPATTDGSAQVDDAATAAAPADTARYDTVVPESSTAPTVAFATEPEVTETASVAETPVETSPPTTSGNDVVVEERVEEIYVAPVAETYDRPETYTPADAYQAPAPIYVQAPTPPVNKGNRGFGILVGLVATATFAAIYALVSLAIAGVLSGEDAVDRFQAFVVQPVFWVPIIGFFAAFALVAAIINRAGWWSWVLGAFFVGLFTYFSFIGAALLTAQAWTLTFDDAMAFLSRQWLSPLAIAAFIIAREVPIWFGAWISTHGRRVTERNVAARQEYDRVIAEGPVIHRP